MAVNGLSFILPIIDCRSQKPIIFKPILAILGADFDLPFHPTPPLPPSHPCPISFVVVHTEHYMFYVDLAPIGGQ